MKKLIIFLFLFFGIVNSSFAFDISGSTYDSVTSTTNGTSGIHMTNGGNTYYAINFSTDQIYQYNLGTTGIINTASFFDGLSILAQTTYGKGITVSNDGTKIHIGNYSTSVIYQYTMSTPFDLTTATYTNAKTGPITDPRDLRLNDSGTILYVLSSNAIYQYSLSTPFDVSTYSLLDSFALANNFQQGFHFSDDFSLVFIIDTWDDVVKQYSMSTPGDLTTMAYDSLLKSVATESGVMTGLTFNSDITKFYGMAGPTIWQYSTNDVLGPPALEVTATGTILMLSNGIQLNGLETNADFSLSYEITEWDGTASYYKDSGDLGSFSGGLNNIDFLNNETFSFIVLAQYDLEIILTDPNDPLNIIHKFYNADYTYNAGYIEPVVGDFSFFVSGMSFFANGFSLDNFVPDPSGGDLYFNIVAPVEGGTGTIDITTEIYLPYLVDGKGYGIDSIVKVTYPYHQVAGTYQVRTVYKYEDLIIYPFGTDYNSYEITLPESPSNYEFEALYICDTDLDGITSTAESFACPFVILKFYSTKVTDNVNALKEFFRQLMNIGTNEVKTFSFIPSANANIFEGIPEAGAEDNVISKLYFFVKGFLYFIFMIFSVGLIILLKRD